MKELDGLDPHVATARLAVRLAALSHPARLRILDELSRSQCCCKDVVERLDLAQSTVSQHLKVLVDAGLVSFAAEGQRSLYRIDREAMIDVSLRVSNLVAGCCAPSIADSKAAPARSQPVRLPD